MKTLLKVFLIVLLFTSYSFTQDLSPNQLRSNNAEPPSDYNLVPKKLGHYTAEDWATVIDTTWGPGLPIADKLQIFDLFWNTIDEDFGGFHNLDINWDSLRDIYRPEIEAGVSRGRFSGIMSHLYLALNETHTNVLDLGVYHEELRPGIPLLVYQSGYYYTDHGHFGAGLTPLPDSSLLVYKVIEDHPLGLALGDIVLGYEGIPWKDLYRQLLEAQLPVTSHTQPFWSFGLYVFGGSSDISTEHIWLTSAGLNWHLFEIIDIVKYGSNDTLHLSTSALIGMDAQLLCTEQLPIPGVPMPDLGHTNISWITWGIVEGTTIGYIYVPSWVSQYGDDIAFTHAVNSLIDSQTTGLIIDSRINAGGQTQTANGGFRRLFNFDLDVLKFAERSNPNDHYAMETVTNGGCSSQYWRLSADEFLYNRPIAVLSGPASWSAGDDNVLLLKFHPMARIFGKPTNTGFTCFTAFENLNIPYQGWFGQYAPQNGFLADDPDNYLMHVGFEVDEEVWLTQEDVARGEDTVVKRAIEWIQNLAHAHDVNVNKKYAEPGVDTVMVTAQVENPNQHELSVETVVRNADSTITDNLKMFDDGLHGDGEANDNLWGNFYTPTPDNEESYKVTVITDDLTDETSRTLPNVSWFTSVGPIELSGYQYASSDTIPNHGDHLQLIFYLKNDGINAIANDISIQATNLDTCTQVSYYSDPEYGDIAPGEIAETDDEIHILFSENCPDSTFAKIKVDILSDAYTFWSDTISIFVHKDPTGLVRNDKNIPLEFALKQNYPNPFNPSTMIKFALPKSDKVKIELYNTLGQRLEILLNQHMKAGYHDIVFNAQNLSSGVYFYRIDAGEFQDVKKMILIK